MWPPPECWSTSNRGCYDCGVAEGSFTTIGTPREFYFIRVERRCKTCLAYRNSFGKESPGLAMRTEDGCKSCRLEEGALRPTTGNPMAFYGAGDEHLCESCYSKRHRKETDKEPCRYAVLSLVRYLPLPENCFYPGATVQHESVILVFGNRKHVNDNGCQRCGTPEGTLTSTGSRLVSYGFGDERLCTNCCK